MQKIAILVLLLVFVMGASAAFGESIFQKIGDNVSKIGEPGRVLATKPVAETGGKNTAFQKVSQGIGNLLAPSTVPAAQKTPFQYARANVDKWDNTLGSGKTLSLRTNPAELMRRRGIKK